LLKAILTTTFVATLLYSIYEFFLQLSVIRAVIAPDSHIEVSKILYSTTIIITLFGKNITLMDVTDPHEITFTVSILGLLLLLDRPLIDNMAKLYKKYVSSINP
jgi:hypothetical protein